LTLLEIIMVLAVMVAVAAMSLPALYGPMEDQRLAKTAELIRAQWTKARVKAIRTGQIHVFRYTVAGDTYVIEPWSGEVDSLEAAADIQPANSQGVPLDSSQLDVPALPLGVNGSRLPDGMFFYAGETTVDARSASISDQGGLGTAASDSASTVVFYPDGTTSDAKLTLTNERCFIEIKIRGLTGSIRVSDLLSAEELTNTGGMVN
jgi:type II secretory pathway pseudopilin PulG